MCLPLHDAAAAPTRKRCRFNFPNGPIVIACSTRNNAHVVKHMMIVSACRALCECADDCSREHIVCFLKNIAMTRSWWAQQAQPLQRILINVHVFQISVNNIFFCRPLQCRHFLMCAVRHRNANKHRVFLAARKFVGNCGLLQLLGTNYNKSCYYCDFYIWMVNWYQYFHEFLEVMFMIAVSFFIIAGRFMSLKLIMFKNIFFLYFDFFLHII